MQKIQSSEITPERVFNARRAFMQGVGVSAASLLLAACAPKPQAGGGTLAAAGATAAPAETPKTSSPASAPSAGREAGSPLAATKNSRWLVDEPQNSFEDITGYNNFYEFTTDKEAVAPLAKGFKIAPWTVSVSGLVNKPATFGIEDLLSNYPQEERVYRMRCVEAWSMVIPWLGFSLAGLLKAVEPLGSAKYVRFETLKDSLQMPGQRSSYFKWPYAEGLRLDEAMHDLTILSTGLYGKTLLPQNGAPLRLVVPWKYGFKSIKSIVKIELVENEPNTFWSDMAPEEYGFYANVNPSVRHPRWSQASERRIGELGRRPTLPFNGYAEEVTQLYSGMDLKTHY